MMNGPDPLNPHPMAGQPRVGFLKALVDHPQIVIGDYTYYDDPCGPEHFVARCVGHLYPFIGDRLVIGRFCALACGVRFVMNGANHAMSGATTYPFNIFGQGWEEGFDPASTATGIKGDTVVGHDVWIGENAVIMPGVSIADGAIVAAQSVVTRDVGAYEIVGGNPARTIRSRFDQPTVERLLKIAWWHWPAETITRHLSALRRCDLTTLEEAAASL